MCRYITSEEHYQVYTWYLRATLVLGKSQVARIIGEIFSDYGILEGNFTEVSRADLIGGYVRTNSFEDTKGYKSGNGWSIIHR